LLWSTLVTSAGYFLGNVIPNIDQYIVPIILLIMLLSFSPSIIIVIRSRIIKSIAKKKSQK